MASAQVLPNSRKLGHLEAGKKKLEEFRKKKAEGRTKKAASTGQLMSSADADQSEKSSQKYENVGDGPVLGSYSNSSGSALAHENKAAHSSNNTDNGASNETHAISPLLVESNQLLYGDSEQNAGKGSSELYDNSTESVIGYYDHWRENRELPHKVESKNEPSDGILADQLNAFSVANTNPNVYMNNSHLHLHSFVKPQLDEGINFSKVYSSQPVNSGVNPASSLEGSEKVLGQNRLGLPGTSACSGSCGVAAPGGGLYHPGRIFHDNTMEFRGGKIADHTDLHFDADNARRRSAESSSFTYKSSQHQQPLPSAGYGATSGRTRPSFLDSLGVSTASSTSHVPYVEPEKVEQPALTNSKILSTEMLSGSSLGWPVSEFKIADQSFRPGTQDYYSEKEFVDSKQLTEESRDRHAKKDQELFTVKKDGDFAALEQYIEDLTQEKFSLQRALDTTQTLVQSLAAENSSLTDSYNQQGKVVSQLRSDMERLQEEIKAQLLAVESIQMEFVNAQLECSAADERAKILASEVIGLEEKALRLRSNELKLEKQLENLSSEITSYKRKVSILEKERQVFQFTIDAMQEEKKLLQSKLRKTSADGKVNDTMTSARRDVSTSTEDIGIVHANLINEERVNADAVVNSTKNPLQDRETSSDLSTDASVFPLLPEDGRLHVPDALADIPHDQLRMIDNINSLISELSLEKEELVGALKIESSNCSKLKDLNKDLSQKLETQTRRLEFLTAQRMATEKVLARPIIDTHSMQDTTESVDEGDEVVERVLGWIMKLFPGGPGKRRTRKLL